MTNNNNQYNHNINQSSQGNLSIFKNNSIQSWDNKTTTETNNKNTESFYMIPDSRTSSPIIMSNYPEFTIVPNAVKPVPVVAQRPAESFYMAPGMLPAVATGESPSPILNHSLGKPNSPGHQQQPQQESFYMTSKYFLYP